MKTPSHGSDRRLLLQMLVSVCRSTSEFLAKLVQKDNAGIDCHRSHDKESVDLNSDLNPLRVQHRVQCPSNDLTLSANPHYDARPGIFGKRRRSRASYSIAQVGTRLTCLVFLCTIGALNPEVWSGGLPSIAEYAGDVSSRYRAVGSNGNPVISRGMRRVLSAPRRGWASRWSRGNMLATAIAELQSGFHATADPFQRAEAAFFLGKAFRIVGDPDASRVWLRSAVEQGVEDYRAEALEMLDKLESP